MKFLSAKKLILIGFIVVLLVAIPLTIFVLQQQQQTQTEAEQITTLSFGPDSTSANPIQTETGQPVVLDVFVDPGDGQNLVSFVRLEIQFDPAKLAPMDETTGVLPFEENAGALTLLEGPVIDPENGTIAATLSVGVDPTKVIQTRTRIATVNFIATSATESVPTEVTFTTTSQVLSAGSSDQANENVLASTVPAYVSISGDELTVSPSPEEEFPNPTEEPGSEATQSAQEGDLDPTTSPIPSPTTTQVTQSGTITPSPTIESGTGQSTNQSPLCESLTADRETTGIAPFSITLNVLGSDADGTVEQATFSYGDGQVENITTGGGLGTTSIDLASSHTYELSGDYQASVVLTDDQGGVSSSNCTISISVTDDGSGEVTPTTIPDATLPETGPGDFLLGFGFAISLLTILGGVLFFAL